MVSSSSKALKSSILLTVFHIVESYTNILTSIDEDRTEPVTRCLQKIADVYLLNGSSIGAALAERYHVNAAIYDAGFIVKRISASVQWSFLSLSEKDCLNPLFYYNHNHTSHLPLITVDHMFLSGNVEQLLGFLERCDVRVLINEFSRFIVTLEEDSGISEVVEDVQRVLDALWRFDQMNVIVLVKTEAESVKIYASFPTTQNGSPVLMDTCSNGTFRNNVDLFPDKINAGLQGFKVRFGARSNPPYFCKTVDGRFIGYEDKIYKVLADHLNYTMVYNVFEEHAGRAILDSVLLGETDVSLGGLVQNTKRLNKFGSTITITRDTVEWFVGGDWTPSEIQDVSKEAIICYMAVYAIFTLAMSKLGTIRNQKKRFYPIWLVAWSLNFEVPYVIRFLTRRQRLLWIFYALYTVNMNALIKSVITSVFTQPLYVQKINTIHQLLQSDVPILLASISNRPAGFPDEENIDYRRIEARLVKCPEASNMRQCVANYLAQGPLSISVFKNAMEVYADFLPKGALRTLEKPIAVYQMSSFARKNYFLVRELRYHMGWFMDVGLIQRWRSEFQRNSQCDMPLGHWRNVNAEDSPELITKRSKFTTITFRRIRSIFVALLVAYGVSFLVFLCEVFFCRPQKRSIRKRRHGRMTDKMARQVKSIRVRRIKSTFLP